MLGLVPPKYQIGKSHLIGSSILLVMVIICFSKADDNFTWEIEKKALQYGEDLRLSCQVENCCIKSVGWVKWTSDDEFDTIFIDVRDLGDEESLKYSGGTDERGFFLIIRNITRNDLNISYSCSYGFTFSKGKVLMEKDVFFGLPITILTDSISKGTTEIIPTSGDKLGLHLKIILPSVLVPAVLAFIVVGIIIVYYKRRLRNNIDEGQGKDIRHSEAQSNMLPKMEKSSNGDTLIPRDLEVGLPRLNRSNCSLLSMQSFISCKST
ncbi:Hypothetical predicted protein [Mytilus galloprovincialis]|uniref:Ig-like domain-containing protein n=2 Tax=Mytilus galloprovincialis TaxID=29158 RepID=A0A8B6CIV3_MYTGA|nr:Hypothetical predicted protein [Mytilus galloprovincialis]